MSDDLGAPVIGITSDNFHLSEPIQPGSLTASDDNRTRAPVHGCTDPKILEFVAAATSSNAGGTQSRPEAEAKSKR